jgi:hypothetical protein
MLKFPLAIFLLPVMTNRRYEKMTANALISRRRAQP